MAQKLEEINKILQMEKKQGYYDSGVVGGFSQWLLEVAQDLPEDLGQKVEVLAGQYSQAAILERPWLWQECADLFAKIPHHYLQPKVMGFALTQEQQAAAQALQTSIQYLKGVGPKKAVLLRHLGIYTVDDLLSYYPRDYELRGDMVKIGDLEVGTTVSVKAKILAGSVIQTGRKLTIFKLLVTDGTGNINAVWFNQRHLETKLLPGKAIYLYGKIERKYNQTELWVQDYELVDAGMASPAKILPLYPSTGNLSQKNIRSLVKIAWEKYSGFLQETLPATILAKHNLPSLREALANIHFPNSIEAKEIARKRLAYDELLVLQLAVLSNRLPDNSKGIQRPKSPGLLDKFLAELPFSLTNAQQRVISQVFADMESPTPMTRLVQGDVGSGKTMVAAAALYKNAVAGYQGALMAPTEILANQHYESLQPLFTKLGLKIAILTGDTGAKDRRELLVALVNGDIQVLIGTHALFQKDVEFKNLALAVTDEQHRFGVRQRGIFQQKGEAYGVFADMLVMTATPIPRTLAMTLYGDLEVSVIDELPPGRQQIETYPIDYGKENRAWGFVEKELIKGRQAYVVCPLVDESDKLELEAATVLCHRLQKQVFKNYLVGLLHGKMKPAEKDQMMTAFAQGEIQILVATTVIEVGINVPNATVMVVRDAERFGLAQLHQLRGRVGRGADKSYCILMHNAKSPIALERMQTMKATTDGFLIAEADLKLRGAGEVFGTRQHGIAEFKAANPITDVGLLEDARADAKELLAKGAVKQGLLWEAVAEKLALLNS